MILKTENLKKSYGKGSGVVNALQNINIEIEKGSFVSIMGKSGSGKSTLLHILSGILSPTSGQVYLESENLFSISDNKRTKIRKKRIGFVFQFFNLFPELTIKENILLPLKIGKQKIDELYYISLIKRLGIETLLDRYPATLSGGQQQRVAIARALIHKPAIVFADEPTGNLDEETTLEVMKLLTVVQKTYKQTIVVVTHDPEIASYANRNIRLKDGLVVEDIMVQLN